MSETNSLLALIALILALWFLAWSSQDAPEPEWWRRWTARRAERQMRTMGEAVTAGLIAGLRKAKLPTLSENETHE